jgi:membrane protein implicated in regulation of membrane protease activity
MVSVLHIRIIGTAMLVLGMPLLLFGILTGDKQVCATCLIVLIIAVTLLYYSKRWATGRSSETNVGRAYPGAVNR